MFDFTKEPGRQLEQKYVVDEKEPLVSIITPFYNASKDFEQTYNSVMNQTFPWFEWIIVDDGSRHEEAEFIDQYVGRDERIHVYHKENGGPSSARNLAISMSSTEYIMPLDADDLIEPQHLECLYWALVTNKEGAWVYSGLVGFGGDQHLWKYIFTSEKEKEENILIINGLIRKSALEDVGGYLELAKLYNEDWHLYLRMLAKGYRPIQIEQYSFWYRVNNTGVDKTVATNDELKLNNLRLINEVKEQVPDGIRSIRFDGRGYSEFESIRKWDWNRKLKFCDKKTRILLIIPHMVMGGADKFNLDLVKNLDREKYSVGIITTVNSENVWKQKFADYVDDIFELPQFLHMREWPAFVHYYISTRDVDLVINISSYYAYYMLPWLRKEFPDVGIIDYVHADCKYWREGGYTRISAQLDNTLEKSIIANKVTMDIMVNDYGKDKDKCCISYIGTDEDYFDPDKVKYGTIRKQFEIDEDRPVVLFLCRQSHEKRGLLMIEIAKQLQKKISDVAFLVVGDGECKPEMENRVHRYCLENTVYFAGSQENVREYYKDSDVLLICSLKEGLTLTTFEGMAMKLPIVSANVGSQGEIVNDKTGAIITCLQDEVNDFAKDNYSDIEINDYVNALYNILTDQKRAKKIGENNRRLIKEKYSFKYAVQLIQDTADSVKDVEKLDERHEKAELYHKQAKQIEEFLIAFNTYERKCVEANEIWSHNCYLQQRMKELEDSISAFKDEREKLINERSELNNRIEHIYSTKCGKAMKMIQTASYKVKCCLKQIRE